MELNRLPGKREKMKGIELVFRLKNQMCKKKKKRGKIGKESVREIDRNGKSSLRVFTLSHLNLFSHVLLQYWAVEKENSYIDAMNGCQPLNMARNSFSLALKGNL